MHGQYIYTVQVVRIWISALDPGSTQILRSVCNLRPREIIIKIFVSLKS